MTVGVGRWANNSSPKKKKKKTACYEMLHRTSEFLDWLRDYKLLKQDCAPTELG